MLINRNRSGSESDEVNLIAPHPLSGEPAAASTRNALTTSALMDMLDEPNRH